MRKTLLSSLLLLGSLGSASAQDWTIDVYGGLGADNSLLWDGDAFDTGNATAFGLGVYKTALLDGFAIGVDVMASDADYIGDTDSISATSVMLASRYALPISDSLSATFGAGLGAMAVSYNVGQESNGYTDVSKTVAGGQAEIGLSYQVANSPAVFGAVKYQAPFGDVEFDDGLGLVIEYNSTSLLFGLSFRM